MPPKHPIVDFQALKLTPEEDALSSYFFARLVSAIAWGDSPTGPVVGIALCVACAEFLGVGIRSGLMSGDLSEERARVIMAGLTRLLPKSS